MLGSLCSYVLASVLLSGECGRVAAFAFSHGSGQHAHQRRAVTLSNTSSCNDLSTYQTENGLTRIDKAMYEKLDAHSTMQNWIFDKGSWDSFTSDFAAPYGVGQTFQCGIPDTCPRINCADLQDPDAPGTGAAYAILLSFANFNLYMENIWESLNMAKDDWNGVQVAAQQTYWPYETPSILLKELVNGLSAIAVILSAAAGPLGPGIAAGAAMASGGLAGIFGGINLALSASDQSLANLANLEANTQTWYQTVFNQLLWTNNNLTQRGWYVEEVEGIKVSGGLNDIIDAGDWVDYTEIAVLNDVSTKTQVGIDSLKKAFYTYLLGNLVNFAWRSQGTFIVKYEMSEDDFNAKGDGWNAGGGDANYRTYDDGYAYFLQRYSVSDDGLYTYPEVSHPPGVEKTGTDLNGCDAPCIMRSAASGFKAHGYNYNFTSSAADFTGSEAAALDWLTDLPGVSGFFNIPVVDLTGNDWAGDADALNKLLVDTYVFDENGQKALYCFVKDAADANGVKFVDQFDKELDELFWNNCNLGYDPE